MTINEMKRILADKLADEGTGFKYNDISITKSKAPMSTEWDEEKDDWKYEMIDAIKVVIKGYEHIHFFLLEEVDEYFGNQIWVYRKAFYPEEKAYSREGGAIVADTYSKGRSFEELTGEALVQLGYYIGSRF